MKLHQQHTQESNQIAAGESTPPPCIKKYIPNTLTLLRLFSTPLCIWAIFENKLTLGLWIYFATSLTDWFDGFLARKWEVTSKFGQILDPIADKVLVISVYTTLGLLGFIPYWLTYIVILRDLLILSIGFSIFLLHGKQRNLPPLFIGKLCAALQMLFIGCTLIHGEFLSPSSSGITNQLMILFSYSVAAITTISGLSYGWSTYKLLVRNK
jgi:cardiolipin synthase (CMP-forming)